MDAVMPYVLALVPTIGVAVLFYVVIKTILEGDRRERIAQARWDAEHDTQHDTGNHTVNGESTTAPPTS